MFKSFQIKFDARFKEPIRRAEKVSTIRGISSMLMDAQIGDEVVLMFPYLDDYVKEFNAGIDRVHRVRVYPYLREVHFFIDFLETWIPVSKKEALIKIAQREGFSGVGEFFMYFEDKCIGSNHYEGVMVFWTDLKGFENVSH